MPLIVIRVGPQTSRNFDEDWAAQLRQSCDEVWLQTFNPAGTRHKRLSLGHVYTLHSKLKMLITSGITHVHKICNGVHAQATSRSIIANDSIYWLIK